MDKKEQIIQAAMKLLIENGMQATPMSAIAKAAGTGMGTIYNYFATKEDLINAIYLYIKEDEMQHLHLPGAETSMKKQFDHYYTVMVRYFLKYPLHYRFMDQFHSSPVLTQDTRDAGIKAFNPVIQFMSAGQQQGIIKDISLEELIQFINGGLMAFIRWMLGSQKQLTDTLLGNQLRIAWDAIKQ